MKNKFILLLLLTAAPLLVKAQSSRIALPSGDVFIKAGLREKVAAAEVVEGRYYRYLQFRSIPTEQQKAALTAAGIRLLDYLPQASYVASIPVAAGAALTDTSIQSVVAVKPSWKLAWALAAKRYPKAALRGAGRMEVTVLHYSDIRPEAAAAVLANRGFGVEHSSPQLHAHRLTIRIADIGRLAAIPCVAYIEPVYAEPQPENLWGRTDHRVNTLATEYAGGLHFDGSGVRLALNDDGVIGPHIDQRGRIVAQYITGNFGNHGDHCSGTIFGAGNLNPTARGMASGAELGVYLVGSAYPTYYQAFDSIYNHYTSVGTRITSTSYSDGNNTGYTSLARLMDIQINDMPELMHVFSSGNSGTSDFGWGAGAGWANVTGGHKQAKNAITVGNVTFQDALNSSSSRGPAKDGRIKPDICAVGTDVYSTTANNTYDTYTGTSMACPGVSGTLAVLYQAYKSMNGGANPPSALIKAAVMNTADDLGNPGPDYRYGYGRINARRAYGILQSGQYRFDSVSQGGARTHAITVPPGVAELRVMLYWHDKAAVTGATKALVNNLNASLLTPAPATVLPWILNPAPNAATLNQNAVQGVDTLNNAEQITIPNPAAGTYTLNVAGFSVPQGPQKYVVVYEFVTDAPVLTYPIGGESLVRSTWETIRWDAYGSGGTFTLQYSTNNGASWTTIASNIAATQRSYEWSLPALVTGQALVRVTRGSQSSSSAAPFSIIGQPSNLTVNWVCTDSISVSYVATMGATGYVVSVLGNQYMDSAAFSTGTSCVVHGINTSQAGWFSVHAVGPNSCKGRRALAQPYSAAPYNCVLAADVAVTGFLSPTTAAQISCDGLPYIGLATIAVKNNGPGVATGTVVKYTANGGPVVAETIPGTIPVGSTVNYTFAMPVSIAPPAFAITAWAEQAADLNHGNDTARLQKPYHVPQPGNTPLYEPFSLFALCDTAANCENTHCALSNGWYNATGDNEEHIDWRVHTGASPSRAQGEATGPLDAADPNGKYLYLESGNCSGRTANLISPCLTLGSLSRPELQFYWHLYGDQGSLRVDILADGTWSNNLFSVSGNQGDGWHKQIVDLSDYAGKTISLRFRGTTASTLSDMAIDNISVDNGGLAVGEPRQQAARLQVSPNPTSTNFLLSLTGAPDGEASWTLTDAAGRIVAQQPLFILDGKAGALVQTETYSAGIYFLQLKGQGFSFQTKLIKL